MSFKVLQRPSRILHVQLGRRALPCKEVPNWAESSVGLSIIVSHLSETSTFLPGVASTRFLSPSVNLPTDLQLQPKSAYPGQATHVQTQLPFVCCVFRRAMSRLFLSSPGRFVYALIALCLYKAAALDNGLARQPPMVSIASYSSVRVALSPGARLRAAQTRPDLQGWNTWNAFHDEINETLVKGAADLLVETGLQAAGYTYLNIDGKMPAHLYMPPVRCTSTFHPEMLSVTLVDPS